MPLMTRVEMEDRLAEALARLHALRMMLHSDLCGASGDEVDALSQVLDCSEDAIRNVHDALKTEEMPHAA